MFGGYLNDADATRAGTQFQCTCFASTKVPILTQNAHEAFTDDGYYKIGDVVRVTRVEHGAMAGRDRIVVLGRAKTSLKLANGLWVFCEALEVPPMYVYMYVYTYVCVGWAFVRVTKEPFVRRSRCLLCPYVRMYVCVYYVSMHVSMYVCVYAYIYMRY
jgi:hypothetical protein